MQERPPESGGEVIIRCEKIHKSYALGRTLLPVRVEVLDDDGGILLYSGLKVSRYVRVRLAGAAAGAGPQFPTLIDVNSTDDSLDVKLSLPDPSDDGIRDDLFDLEWLTNRFRPEIMGREGP